MKSKKYQFIWREFGISNLIADLVSPLYFITEGFIIYEKPNAEGYVSQKEIKLAEKVGFELCTNEEKVKRIIKRAEKLAKEGKQFFNYIKRINLGDKNDREIYLLLKNFIKKIVPIFKIYFITEPHYFGCGEQIIRNSVFKKIEERKKAYKYLSILVSSLVGKNVFNLREISWCRPKIDRRKNTIEKELDLSNEIKIIANSIRELGLMRINLAPYWRFGLEVLELFINEIARRKHLAPTQAASMSFLELRNSLLYKKEPPLEKLNLRKEKFVYVFKRGKTKTLTGEKAEKYNLITSPVLNKKIKELKGSVAHPGIAKGKVRVFRHIEKDLSGLTQKMKRNEILVTEMTRPQVMTVVKKASAIITDEGGVNCHAAIISRELDTPCIIGTRVATKVLKDGDLVEVDANKGVVRILERSK